MSLSNPDGKHKESRKVSSSSYRSAKQKQDYQLEDKALTICWRMFLALLLSVSLHNVLPVTISIWKRLPDDVVQGIQESNLLMTNALCGGVGFFLGRSDWRKDSKKNDGEEKKTDDEKTAE